MNSYTGTPVNTVWFGAFIAALMGLLGLAGPNAISAIFSISVVGSYIAYSIPIAARFIFHKENNFKPGPFNLGSWGLPVAVIAIAWMSLISVVFLFPVTPQTDAQDMNYSVVVTGGTLILSLVWYYFPKYGGVYWFKGPVSTIDNGETSSSETSSEIEKSRAAKGQENLPVDTGKDTVMTPV
jgi:amino acid transporter